LCRPQIPGSAQSDLDRHLDEVFRLVQVEHDREGDSEEIGPQPVEPLEHLVVSAFAIDHCQCPAADCHRHLTLRPSRLSEE
jgi:hypothetical protein